MSARPFRRTALTALLASALTGTVAAQGTTVPAPSGEAARQPRVLWADKDLADLRLVRSTAGSAVVQLGSGPLEVVKVGDRLGRNRAEIIEIEVKRLVLDERFTGRDGAPNRARVVVRDGERGGTRYYERLDETSPPARRPMSK